MVKNGDRYFLFAETGHLIIAKMTPKGYEEIDRASSWSQPTLPSAAPWFGATRFLEQVRVRAE